MGVGTRVGLLNDDVNVSYIHSFQWFFWGYSLAFAETSSPFLGNLQHFALMGVLDLPSIGSSRIPALLFCIYQSMFAIITGILMIGGFAERARIGPVLLFIFCWLTVVYCPIGECVRLLHVVFFSFCLLQQICFLGFGR
jgi:ammonia channel protein AmtB